MSSCTCRARTQNSNQTEIMNSVFLRHLSLHCPKWWSQKFYWCRKQLAKRSRNPRWVKSNMVSHLSYQCIISCFLTTKNNLTFKTILTESGKKKEQKQRDALVYNSRPFNNGYPLDTTKLLVIKSNNDSISSHKGKMVETGWQGVMEIYNVCEMKAWEERSISPPFPYPFWNSAPNKENGSESVLC